MNFRLLSPGRSCHPSAAPPFFFFFLSPSCLRVCLLLHFNVAVVVENGGRWVAGFYFLKSKFGPSNKLFLLSVPSDKSHICAVWPVGKQNEGSGGGVCV